MQITINASKEELKTALKNGTLEKLVAQVAEDTLKKDYPTEAQLRRASRWSVSKHQTEFIADMHPCHLVNAIRKELELDYTAAEFLEEDTQFKGMILALADKIVADYCG